MDFDAVEILHMQMESEESAYLQRLKRQAFVNGVSLCGMSTHQGFLSPDAEVRQKNIEHTIHAIELAYALGIPRSA
jgi:L-ribulose-5-phosphate 3-epimerase